MRNGVTEAGADGFVDPQSSRIARLGQRLHLFQFGGQRHVRRQFDSRRTQEARHRLLRKIGCSDAGIAGPLVHGRIITVIDRRESQLIQPTGNGAFRRDIPRGQAAPHCDAENAVVAHGHGSGQGGDFAIVHHLKRHSSPRDLQFAK